MSGETATPSGLAAKVDKKRKRHAEESSKETKAAASKPTGDVSEGHQKKKKRKNGNKKTEDTDKPKMIRGEPLEKERKGGMDESIGKMDGRLLADHFAQKAKRHNKELTAVELSDISVPDSAFLDTSSFDAARTLEKLPDFLKAFSPNKGVDFEKASQHKGTPHTIVVSPAGLRAADVVRSLRTFQTKESPIGKLFAKHIKLEEAKQFLDRARVAIGAGTPARISDLIDSGSLKLDELERIVIDGSDPSTLLKLLTRSEFRERYGAKQKGIKILVF
ncbi:hypothetical protein AOCH_001060 [Aspergillus ochraceoroseus]|uniref:U3-containing 90S pre-ribosomal complex subunit-domain containing protein n=1 Tax=Aspergillus ochraceoroseus TaxID=138278 RepID=A0A0F8U436_9EURO|nr:hypothetical protein AOCH_001060 [Aspergillus ochraceoroseus]